MSETAGLHLAHCCTSQVAGEGTHTCYREFPILRLSQGKDESRVRERVREQSSEELSQEKTESVDWDIGKSNASETTLPETVAKETEMPPTEDEDLITVASRQCCHGDTSATPLEKVFAVQSVSRVLCTLAAVLPHDMSVW